MSQREASVKLTLDDGQFLVSMRRVGDEGEKAGHKGQKSMGLFGQGIKGAEHAVHGLHRSLETVTELAVGLAGAFSLEEALRNTISLETKYKQLGFRIGIATQGLLGAEEVHKRIEEASAKTGRSNMELANSYEQMFAATGNADFAGDVIETLGTMATATGIDLHTLGGLAENLHKKFGVTAEEMQDVFGQVFEAAQKGGPSFEEFADVSANVGAELLAAGLDGRRGLDIMLGSLVATDQRLKSLPKQVRGLQATLRALGDKDELKKVAAGAGIDPTKLINDKDAIARIHRIFGKGATGVKALLNTLKPGEEQETMKILFVEPFEKAMLDAKASGKKGQAAIDAALAELDQGIEQMGKAHTDGATIQKRANDAMKDPAEQLRIAMDHLEKSFEDPRIVEAINRLAQYLPKMADGAAKFIKFAMDHPLLAGGAVVGAKAGMGFGGAIAETLLQKGMHKAGHGVSELAKAALASDTGKELQAYKFVIEEAHVAGGMKVGSIIQGAGAAAGIAIAAYLAKQYIDSTAEESAKTTGDLSTATARAASRTGGIEKQQEEAEALRQSIEAKKDQRSGLSGGMEDFFGGIGQMVTGVQSSGSIADDQIAQAEAELREKEAFIQQLREKEKKGEKPLDGKQIARDFAKEFKAQGGMNVNVNLGSFVQPGPGGSRGPRKPAAPPQHGGGIG